VISLFPRHSREGGNPSLQAIQDMDPRRRGGDESQISAIDNIAHFPTAPAAAQPAITHITLI